VKSSPLISVKDVSLSFMRDKLESKIIDNVSFDIHEGEFTSIVGPSGCGKSSLIRIITGLLEPTKGEVLYHNVKVKNPPIGMSLVFQNFALLPWRTAIENVKLALENTTLSEHEIIKRSADMLKKANLEGYEAAYPSELSGGMKQRVGIARALVSDPEIILMDEPFSSLDDLTASQLRSEVYSILKNESTVVKAVIMVSHNVEEVVSLSDRVIVLHKPPSHIVDDIRIKIKYPRNKNSTKFTSIVNRIYKDLY
jgi:NitT/TauT family transport system ATP-binding protein